MAREIKKYLFDIKTFVESIDDYNDTKLEHLISVWVYYFCQQPNNNKSGVEASLCKNQKLLHPL